MVRASRVDETTGTMGQGPASGTATLPWTRGTGPGPGENGAAADPLSLTKDAAAAIEASLAQARERRLTERHLGGSE